MSASNLPTRVLFLAAEAAPFVKVGGLGDVAGSLPPALRRLGADVRLVLPLHHLIERQRHNLQYLFDLHIPSRLGDVPAQVYAATLDGLPVYFISSALFPASNSIYGLHAADAGPRYIHFSLAALELARRLDFRPGVVHAQDWHTATALYALALMRPYDAFFARTASLLTVHNLPYQGAGAEDALHLFGLPPAMDSALPWWAKHRPLALGLHAADHINTVSPSYAAEMLTPEFGADLDGYLRAHKRHAISGILNGLDVDSWNPQTDPALAANYTAADPTPKKENKTHLQRAVGLPVDARLPVLGLVSRMDHQKGIDIALEALRLIRGQAWQAVILGNGHPQIEAAAWRLGQDFRWRMSVHIDFNTTLGRQIYAGADIFLIPSRYEPCGLTQMISMRYGTVPLARAVGGLRDTITDESQLGATGFLFGEASPWAMAACLARALDAYADQPRWRLLQQQGMAQDFSWEQPARQYLSLYQRLISARMG